MSSTNGSGKREGDFYPTPQDLAEKIVWLSLPERFHIEEEVFTILEPSAGNGTFVTELRKATDHLKPQIIAVEPGPQAAQIQGADFVAQTTLEQFAADNPEPEYDLIVGNPPFSLAEEHVRICLSLLRPGGRLSFLLRAGFLSHREKLYTEFPPDDVWMLHHRPTFVWKWQCGNPESKKPKPGCGHEWSLLPEERTTTCPECGGPHVRVKTRSDSADYCIISWLKGVCRGTTLEWI